MNYVVRCMIILIGLTSLAACGQPYEYQAIRVLDDLRAAPDFMLIDQHGQPFRLSEQTGTIKVLFFGFTSCPDVCPTTLSDMAYVREQLGATADEVQMVFITVDPERDTSDQIKRYLSIFDGDFVGLRGEHETLAALMREYGVAAARHELPDSALGYTVDHSTSLYVIDQQGRWFAMYGHGEPLKPFIEDLRHLAQNS